MNPHLYTKKFYYSHYHFHFYLWNKTSVVQYIQKLYTSVRPNNIYHVYLRETESFSDVHYAIYSAVKMITVSTFPSSEINAFVPNPHFH